MTLPTPTLRGPRLLLRPFTEADTDALFAVFSDLRVARYWNAPAWTERAQAERFIASAWRNAQEGHGANFAIDGPDGRFIGQVGIFDLIRAFQRILKRFENASDFREIVNDRYTVADKIEELLQTVAVGTKIKFEDLFTSAASRLSAVSNCSAVASENDARTYCDTPPPGRNAEPGSSSTCGCGNFCGWAQGSLTVP